MHKMNKLHPTLKPTTNIVLILVWGVAVVMLLTILDTWPIYILVSGSALGLIGGLMQIQSFKESKQSFQEAKTMIEVRNSLKNTKWGKRYLYFLWTGNALLVVIAFLTANNPLLSILAGYFLLMFVREIVTLKPTMELNNA